MIPHITDSRAARYIATTSGIEQCGRRSPSVTIRATGHIHHAVHIDVRVGVGAS